MTERPLTRDIFGIAPLDPKERISLCQRAERLGEMFMPPVVLSYEETLLEVEAQRDALQARIDEMEQDAFDAHVERDLQN